MSPVHGIDFSRAYRIVEDQSQIISGSLLHGFPVTLIIFLFDSAVGDLFFRHDIETGIILLSGMFAELTHHILVNGDIILSRFLELLQFCETDGMADEIPEIEGHCLAGAAGFDFFQQTVQRIESYFRAVFCREFRAVMEDARRVHSAGRKETEVSSLPCRFVVFGCPASFPAALIRSIIYQIASDRDICFGEGEIRNPDI